MEEKLKFIGMLAISFSVMCLAAAIVYFGFELKDWRKELPGVIDPLVEEIGESKEMIPDVLEEMENTNATVRTAVKEIQQTREAIPGFMDRADQIVANAGEASRQAGKGAITGVIGGIVAAPFGVLGGIGKDLMGSEDSDAHQKLTEEDHQIFKEKLLDLAENGTEGDAVTWENRGTSNNGKITLLRKFVENGQECREVKVETSIEGQKAQERTVSGCRQPDGSWIASS